MSVLEEQKRILDEVADGIITKGYYRVPELLVEHENEDWRERYKRVIIPAMTVRKFARRVCKEHKRPFIMVDRWADWRRGPDGNYKRFCEGVWLEIPKRRYLMPIVNCLRLAAVEDVNTDGVYWNRNCKSVWWFGIRDQAFAREYLSFFETREEFRKAVKLPPKVTELHPMREAA
jgi:hypothetical protein